MLETEKAYLRIDPYVRYFSTPLCLGRLLPQPCGLVFQERARGWFG